MILKGMEVSNDLSTEILRKVKKLKESGIVPALGILRVGTKEDDLAYERNIVRKFEKLEIQVKIASFPESAKSNELIEKVKEWNVSSDIHGILLFRPLPGHLDEESIRNAICMQKDVDCASDESLSSIFLGKGEHLPCTAGAVMEMLNYYRIPISGKNVTVIGRSMVVGKPLALRLLQENATVTIAHSKTADPAKLCRNADIIVVATGHVNTLTADMVSEHSVVIDVGINYVEGRLVGDVDFEHLSKKVNAISPVPGGVGSITTSVLAKYVVEEAWSRNNC